MKWNQQDGNKYCWESDCKKYRIAGNRVHGVYKYTAFVAEPAKNHKGETVMRWYPLEMPTTKPEKAREAAERWATQNNGG